MKSKIITTEWTLELTGLGGMRQIGKYSISHKDYSALKMEILETLQTVRNLSTGIQSLQRWFNCPYVVIESAVMELIRSGMLDHWQPTNTYIKEA